MKVKKLSLELKPTILLWAIYPSFGDETTKGWFPYDRYNRYDSCDRCKKRSAALVVAIIWKTLFSARCEMM